MTNLIQELENDKPDIDISTNMEGFEFKFKCKFKQNIEEILHLANNMMRSVVNRLIVKNRKGSITSIFEFPEHVRVPCEQYLIYFAEFLNNIGIKATTEITHQARNVLFTVVPESRKVALNNIQEALEIYLQLPSIINDMGYNNLPIDPQIQQLISNVYHFKSQVALMNSTIQLQSQTIQRQQTFIEQQQKVLDSKILQTSLVSVSSSEKEEDKEELFGGMMALSKLEVKGIEFNFANIYRLLKRWFKK